MKHRLGRLLAVLALVGLLGGVWWSWPLLFPPPLPRDLSAIVPADPLLYLQGSRLQQHLTHLTQRPEYAEFLDSEFLATLNQTAWWPGVRENFLAFWQSLVIDPMHIVGHETALALYAGDADDILPRAILIGKTDRIARVAERLMYAYESVAHQIGITPVAVYRGHAVYALQTYDMYWPLYYAVAGEAGLISTSVPLLHDTLDMLESTSEPPASLPSNSSVFTHAYPVTEADSRVLGGYLDLKGFQWESRRNPLLRAVGFGRNHPSPGPAIHTVLTLAAESNHLMSQIQWFSEEMALSGRTSSVPNRAAPSKVALPHALSEPLVVSGSLARVQAFWRTGQTLFPAWNHVHVDIDEHVYGDRLECVVSEQVSGLIYQVPDLECVLDTHDAAASTRLLDAAVRTALRDTLPPLAYKGVNSSTTTYQDIAITSTTLKMAFVTQPVAHYATVLRQPENTASTVGYTAVSNSLQRLQRRLDALAEAPATPPYALDNPGPNAAFQAVLAPHRIAQLLHNFAQTPTYSVMLPAELRPLLNEALPPVVQGLRILPPMTVTGMADAGGLGLEVRMVP